MPNFTWFSRLGNVFRDIPNKFKSLGGKIGSGLRTAGRKIGGFAHTFGGVYGGLNNITMIRY